jgi:SagB-type dehydrogenase family enzyme
MSLSEAILTRASARGMKPAALALPTLATLLHHAYGVTRDETASGFPRVFRAAPSGGALYPLELFFHSRYVEGAPPGVYHYNPLRNEIRRVRDEDQTPRIAELLIPFQNHLAQDAALIVFITALFGRSTFKYSTRGYRFALLEAGHVAQNLGLAAGALGLAYLNVGGYFDRHVDEFLGLDGLTHSTIYMAAIGAHPSAPA